MNWHKDVRFNFVWRTIDLIRNKRTVIFFFSSLLLQIHSAHAQQDFTKGTEFWAGVMKNHSSNAIPYITLIGKPNTFVRIEYVANGGGFQKVKIPSAGFIEFQLPTSQVQTPDNYKKTNGIHKMGMYIIADDSIQVLIFHGQNTDASDATFIKPVEALGYEYRITSWFEPNKGNVPEFLILATVDSTPVSVQMANGSDTTFTLYRGDFFQYKSITNDLSGSFIKALCNADGRRNPIAVFAGNANAFMKYRMHGSGSDYLMTQFYPVEHWGRSFHLPLLQNSQSYVFITAKENGTQFTLGSATLNLNAGEIYRGAITSPSTLVSNNPISVQIYSDGNIPAQFGSLGGPYLLNVSPDDQGVTSSPLYYFDDGIRSSVIRTRRASQNLMVITRTGTQVYLDSRLIGPWVQFPDDPQYSYCNMNVLVPTTVNLNQANGVFLHMTSPNGTFNAYVYSHESPSSTYGYTIGHNAPFSETTFEIGYNGDTLPSQLFNDTICACELTWFQAEYTYGPTDFIWDFGDGTTFIGNTAAHTFANGNYSIEVSPLDKDGCKLKPAYKHNLFVENCDIFMWPPEPICMGDTAYITSRYGSTFQWSTGDTSRSISVSPDSTTTFRLSVDNGAISICDSITVYVNPLPDVILDDSIVGCSNKRFFIESPLMGKFLWSNGDTTSRYEIKESGYHWLQFTDTLGCTGFDTTYALFTEPPVWSLPDVELNCFEADYEIFPQGDLDGTEQYRWSTKDSTTSILVNETGNYKLRVFDGICTTVDTAHIFFSCYTFHAPNSFTPNNDGLNEAFRIQGKGIDEFHITIQNSWGEVMFESSELTVGWYGTIRGSGRQASEGYYTYIARTRDVNGLRHTHTGSITLLR